MVVVVTDTILIAGGRTSGLDSPDETFPGQDFESVVYGLPRNGTDIGTNDICDVFRRTVGPTRHSPQHAQSLGCDLDTMTSKKARWINVHESRLDQLLD